MWSSARRERAQISPISALVMIIGGQKFTVSPSARVIRPCLSPFSDVSRSAPGRVENPLRLLLAEQFNRADESGAAGVADQWMNSGRSAGSLTARLRRPTPPAFLCAGSCFAGCAMLRGCADNSHLPLALPLSFSCFWPPLRSPLWAPLWPPAPGPVPDLSPLTRITLGPKTSSSPLPAMPPLCGAGEIEGWQSRSHDDRPTRHVRLRGHDDRDELSDCGIRSRPHPLRQFGFGVVILQQLRNAEVIDPPRAGATGAALIPASQRHLRKPAGIRARVPSITSSAARARLEFD